jgi:hypothetical protein
MLNKKFRRKFYYIWRAPYTHDQYPSLKKEGYYNYNQKVGGVIGIQCQWSFPLFKGLRTLPFLLLVIYLCLGSYNLCLVLYDDG